MKKRDLFSLKSSKGFTLVELLASLAIITIILSVVIYNHREFDSQLELTNVAYRVAVSIREAQVYGIGARELNGSFNIPYGVSFFNNGSLDSKKTYVFFGDSNPPNPVFGEHPNVYDGPVNTGCDGGATDECIERITIGAGNVIKKVCAYSLLQSSSDGFCIPVPFNYPGNPVYIGGNSLNVVFKRPKSDATITLSKVMSGTNIPVIGPEPLTDLFICLQSPQGSNKAVHVSSAGQISVEDAVYTGSVEIDGSVCISQ